MGMGPASRPLLMEKIERLAKLKPLSLDAHSEDLFKILRGFVVLDWILRNPNDLGQKKSEAKFRGLMEKAAELMDKIQAETEEHEARLVDVTAGES
jgi:hypothetical protein